MRHLRHLLQHLADEAALAATIPADDGPPLAAAEGGGARRLTAEEAELARMLLGAASKAAASPAEAAAEEESAEAAAQAAVDTAQEAIGRLDHLLRTEGTAADGEGALLLLPCGASAPLRMAPHASSSAAVPGRAFPSSSSSDAPPPVLTKVTFGTRAPWLASLQPSPRLLLRPLSSGFGEDQQSSN